MTEPVTVTLSTPINDGKIKELEVKAPNFRTLRRTGLPFRDGEIDFDRAAEMLEACTGTPSNYLDEMDSSDVMKCVNALAGMIGGDTSEVGELAA